MRCVSMGVLALAALLARAEDTVYDIQIGGSNVGTVTHKPGESGAFESFASLKVGATTAESTLKGKWKEKRLVSWDLAEKVNTQSAHIVWDGKKARLEMNGKLVKADIPADFKTRAFMSNYHLGIASTILAESDAKGKPDIEIVVLNAAAPVKAKLVPTSTTVTISGRAMSAVRLKGSVASSELELVFIDGECVGMAVPAQLFRIVRKGYDGAFVDPLAAYPELSQPTFKVVQEHRLRAKMRDGVELLADVSRPEGEGKYPAILMRTPYGRVPSLLVMEWLAKRGYAVVSQDVRGRGASGGNFDPFNTEVADGKDTLDWLAAQPWCNGNVGMIGGSYGGLVQWAAAVNHHPALKCIIPQVSPPEPTRNVPWDNGAFMLAGSIWWSRIVMDRQADMAEAIASIKNFKAVSTLPLTKVDDNVAGRNIPFFDTWLKRPNRADWPGAFTTEQVATVKIPTLHISGTWDGDGVGTMLHWQTLRKSGGNQWMIFGPWDHAFNTRSKFGDQDFGAKAPLELDSVYLRFFDAHLKQKPVGLDKMPRVRFFVTGSNQWAEGEDWPLPTAKAVTYHLAGGAANGGKSKGALGGSPSNAIDRMRYRPSKIKLAIDDVEVDPDKAVTTMKATDLEDSMLAYRTPPFTEATTLAGPLDAELFVSTTAKDATFFVQVFEETPAGKLIAIAMQGTRRVGFQDGALKPIVPGKVYRITVSPWLFARQFKKGSRLVVVVRPDMFPNFARNPGTGEADATATKLANAVHSVYKTKAYPSRVTLWKLP